MSDFIPWGATRVADPEPKGVETVGWFKTIAHRFPAREWLPENDTPTTDDGTGIRRALFGSIEAVAETESRKNRTGDSEPADVRQMRLEAIERARIIVEEAKEQARIIIDESREEGFKQGYEAGRSAGEQEAVRETTERADAERAVHRTDLSAFMDSVETSSRQAWVDMELEILNLVFEIARKVIKMEVQLNREAAVEVVKNTLRRVADSTSLRIRVHADDLQTVRANREELYTMVDGIRKVEIIEDRRVGPGGCILETDAGTIDARIETQMEEIRKLLAQSNPSV